MIVFAILFSSYGYNNTWRLWNIPVMSPHFADLRCITHGAESASQGFNPMTENPMDPWKRKLSYPRIWQSLSSIGIDQTHTTYIGMMFIFFYLTGVCLFLPQASIMTVALVFAAVLSPAALLGVERANADLLIFFLASVSIVAAQRSYVLSAFAILIGFTLKLFPIFGWTVLLGADKSKFRAYTLIMFFLVSSYIAATFQDILLVIEGTPKSIGLSYGLNVFWMTLAGTNVTIGMYARVLSYLSVILILTFALSALLRNDQPLTHQSNTVSLGALRVGSAIYTGTFLLGNNWDYRLIFLIFTIPQLILWRNCSAKYIPIISKLTLFSIFVSLWYMIIVRILDRLPYGSYLSFALHEASGWIIFSCLAYLLLWSAPAWIRQGVQKICLPTSRSA